MIGQQINQFKITEKLGAGGMGEVFLAEDTKLKRKVALKFLPAHYSQDPEFKSRFEHEATASAALNHPNIVTVYELGEFEGKPFIAMEYLEGQSLNDLIAGGDVKFEKAIRIALHVAEGLSAAHEAGIVHRDIKPGNIMIDKSGRVKILDFGLAKSRRATTDTQAGTTVGTAQYESPEQGRGEQVDQRSDLFSLGVVLYEMVAGRLPFTGEFTDAIRYAIANEDPEPLERYKAGVPAELQRIVSRLLEKDPEVRYQNAAAVISDLKLLERDSGSRISTAYSPTPAKKKSRPRVLAAILIPTVLIAAAVVAAVVLKPWNIEISSTQHARASENRLAVMYFNNVSDPGDEQRMGEIATNLLITDLSQHSSVQVVSSQRLYDLLKQLGHEGSRTVGPDLATQVADKAQARWMLTGSLLRTEPDIILTAQLVEMSSGDVVSSHRINGASGDDIFAIVDSLSDVLCEALELPTPSDVGTSLDVADVTTHSMEAYRHYLEGRELLAKFFFTEAATLFQTAIKYDSTFAMAYYFLAALGSGGSNSSLEHLETARRFAQHVSDRERQLIEALYQSRNQDDRAIESYRKLVKDYPDEKYPYRQLATLTGEAYGGDSALYYLHRLIELDPTDKRAYNTLAYTYQNEGQFEESVEAINKYIELAPDEPNPYDSRGDLYAYNGRFEEAADSYRTALDRKPDYYTSLVKLGDMYLLQNQMDRAESCYVALTRADESFRRAEGRMRLAVIPAHQGRLEEALSVFRDGLAADRMEKIAFVPILKLVGMAIIEWVQGNYEAAAASAREAHELIAEAAPRDPDQMRGFMAWMEVYRGNQSAADSLMDIVRKNYKDQNGLTTQKYLITEGTLAVAKGDPHKAIEWYERAAEVDELNEFGAQYFSALAYLDVGEAGEAVRLLERLVNRYSDQAMAALPVLALCHYDLGRAYEVSGWTKKAILKYQFFLDLWKDADPGLPAVEDAKARLAALQS
jgi:serine/threonine protein kinase/tetratricopeptide (TPR) repeat protein